MAPLSLLLIFGVKLPLIQWWMPAIVVAVAGIVLYIRRQQQVIQQIKCFIGRAPFGMLWGGFIVVALIAQLVGNGQFLRSSMGEDYHRAYKLFVEEFTEPCGYLILFFGALEAVVFKEKSQQNAKENTLPRTPQS